MESCLFCKIINKEIPADIIYEDDIILIFKDIHPKSPTHLLIIPKKHIDSLNEAVAADQEVFGKIMLQAKAIAEQYDFAKTGYRMVLNTGRDGGQVIYHMHWHLMAGHQMSDL